MSTSEKSQWTHIIVHHTGAEEKDAAQVKRYHLGLGWRDIGYHFVIERDGQVVTGRSLSLAGAHCSAGKMNYRGIGVALIGNLELHPPLPEQEKALIGFAGELAERFSIPASNLLGHREVPGAATKCPGRCMDMGVIRQKIGKNLQEKVTGTLYRVQIGAFNLKENAEALAVRVRGAGFPAAVVKWP